jgi:hypothetical protein
VGGVQNCEPTCLRADAQGTTAVVDPAPYMQSSATMEKAKAELKRFGFKIEAQRATLSISAPPELFEQTCGVQLMREQRRMHEPGTSKAVILVMYGSSEPVLHIPELNDIIEGIVLVN